MALIILRGGGSDNVRWPKKGEYAPKSKGWKRGKESGWGIKPPREKKRKTSPSLQTREKNHPEKE